jgi:hypothetical protein
MGCVLYELSRGAREARSVSRAGTDQHAAIEWMIEHSSGGDVVVT